MTDTTREQWLTTAATIIEHNVLLPAINRSQYSLPQPLKYKVSIGFPKSRKAIGECWSRSASKGEYNAIFINPTINDSIRVLDVLTHELVHASDDNKSRHQNYFAGVARACDLQGKFTATHAGDKLTEQLLDIIDVLGDIPHTPLSATYQPKPKQTSRMIKVLCSHCGFNFRASQTQIDRITSSTCNACNSNTLATTN